MITNKIHTHRHMITLLLITALALLTVTVINIRKIDCNDPHVWGTESGVQYCAVSGGK